MRWILLVLSIAACSALTLAVPLQRFLHPGAACVRVHVLRSPVDPWGRPWCVRWTGKHGCYSFGPNGIDEGGEGDDVDVNQIELADDAAKVRIYLEGFVTTVAPSGAAIVIASLLCAAKARRGISILGRSLPFVTIAAIDSAWTCYAYSRFRQIVLDDAECRSWVEMAFRIREGSEWVERSSFATFAVFAFLVSLGIVAIHGLGTARPPTEAYPENQESKDQA